MKVAIVGPQARMVASALDANGIAYAAFERLDDLLSSSVRATIEIVVASGYVAIDDAALALLPGLHGIVSPFTGVEGFDRIAASARGILIGNGQIDENVDSMAEATVLLLLAAAYRLPTASAAMADGAWPRPAARGRLLKAMTVGVVGYGRIAQAVAARLAPFGCKLLIYAPRLHVPLPPGAEAVTLVDLAARSDALLVLASLGPDSRHLIDADIIARLKPDAIVVNTARGGLIDEMALVAAAQAGRIGTLALDVFEAEPLPADSPVRGVPNAILTPHTLGHTRETITRLPLHALANIQKLLQGEPPLTLVNPEALPLWRARIEDAPLMTPPPFLDRVLRRLPRRELERRWAAVRARMEALDLDAIVAFSTEDFLGGYARWLTDRPAYYGYGSAVVFHRNDLMSLVEHGFMGTRREMADKEPDFPGVGELFQTSAFHSVNYTNGYEAEIIADLLRRRGYKRVALAGGGAMPHAFVSTLAEVAGMTFIDDTDALDLLRAVKSPDEEIEIRHTAHMQDRVLDKVLAMIKPRIHDRDIMATIQAEGRLEGSEQGVIMVGSAPAGQAPFMRHPRFQNRQIESGDSVTILIENNGAAGFYTELGRVVTVGRRSNAYADAIAQMVEAQDASVALMKPGTPCAEIAKAHDAHMQARGHPPEKRLYSHGQGYSLVERPLVRADETMSVEGGMTFPIHPIYADAAHFAFICDNFWINASGAPERLHASPRSLIEVDAETMAATGKPEIALLGPRAGGAWRAQPPPDRHGGGDRQRDRRAAPDRPPPPAGAGGRGLCPPARGDQILHAAIARRRIVVGLGCGRAGVRDCRAAGR